MQSSNTAGGNLAHGFQQTQRPILHGLVLIVCILRGGQFACQIYQKPGEICVHGLKWRECDTWNCSLFVCFFCHEWGAGWVVTIFNML